MMGRALDRSGESLVLISRIDRAALRVRSIIIIYFVLMQ